MILKSWWLLFIKSYLGYQQQYSSIFYRAETKNGKKSKLANGTGRKNTSLCTDCVCFCNRSNSQLLSYRPLHPTSSWQPFHSHHHPLYLLNAVLYIIPFNISKCLSITLTLQITCRVYLHNRKYRIQRGKLSAIIITWMDVFMENVPSGRHFESDHHWAWNRVQIIIVISNLNDDTSEYV